MKPIATAAFVVAFLADCTYPARQAGLELLPDTSLVAVDSVWAEDGKIAIAYRIALPANWTGNDFAFLIRPGVPLRDITTDFPGHLLDSKVTYEGRNAIEWTAMDPSDRPKAGERIGGFILKARARFGPVRFMVQNYEPPSMTSEDQLGDPPALRPFWERGPSGVTLGPVGTLPSSRRARIEQLVGDLDHWCGEDSLASRATCRELSEHASELSPAAGSTEDQQLATSAARMVLGLNEHRRRTVPEAVYWQLYADLLNVRLPEPVPQHPAESLRRGLMASGDTFEMRRFGGIGLDSSAIGTLPCTQRPPVSEILIVNDEADYSVVRVVTRGCSGTVRDTQSFGSTYRLFGDTVQFYLSDGGEARTGMRALVSLDSLVGLGGESNTRTSYVRRNRRFARDQTLPAMTPDTLQSMPITFSHFLGESPRGDTNWIVIVRSSGQEAWVQLGYNLGRNTTDRSTPGSVVDSAQGRLLAGEMATAECMENGRNWGKVLGFVPRGSINPKARIAWRLSLDIGKVASIPVKSVQCSLETAE